MVDGCRDCLLFSIDDDEEKGDEEGAAPLISSVVTWPGVRAGLLDRRERPVLYVRLEGRHLHPNSATAAAAAA